MQKDKTRVAVLMSGTCREVEFILDLFPYLAGELEYDIFLVLRHVNQDEKSRLGSTERDFQIANLSRYSNNRLFIAELPAMDPAAIRSRFLLPVGPTGLEREQGVLSMYHGVFAAISMMKCSLRQYSYVMKTRTDFLPWKSPWLEEMCSLYHEVGEQIIIDGHYTKSQLYPDRPDIPWQGSISDAFCFASFDKFLQLWDIESMLPKVWTGVAESTLFRAALLRFIGDSLQSPRRNEAFLNKYFYWKPNESGKSYYLLRAGVLTDEIKQMLVRFASEDYLKSPKLNQLIRACYDFVFGDISEGMLNEMACKFLPDEMASSFFSICKNAKGTAAPI